MMKGKEANTTDVLINITNATVQATNAFLTSLIIPNHKMWVTMVFESPCGDVLLITFVRENPIIKSISLSGKEAL